MNEFARLIKLLQQSTPHASDPPVTFDLRLQMFNRFFTVLAKIQHEMLRRFRFLLNAWAATIVNWWWKILAPKCVIFPRFNLLFVWFLSCYSGWEKRHMAVPLVFSIWCRELRGFVASWQGFFVSYRNLKIQDLDYFQRTYSNHDEPEHAREKKQVLPKNFVLICNASSHKGTNDFFNEEKWLFKFSAIFCLFK